MGQYYKIATQRKGDEAIKVYTPQVKGKDYTGIKLLEHSYVGNDTMNAVSNLIFHNPHKIAWVGDYSNDDERADVELRQMLHSACWGGKYEEHSWDMYEGDTSKWKYLVNHTKHLYIDMEKYAKNSAQKETLNDGTPIVIHPLSLLTAIGNGMGGGDYYGTHPNYNETGSWAWDEISIEDKIPDGYLEYSVIFREDCNEEETRAINNTATYGDAIKVDGSYYGMEYINNSWGEAYYYMLVQKDKAGDIPLAVGVGSNGRKNLEFMRDNEYDKEQEYDIVQISASDYIGHGLALDYDLFDLLTDAVRNMGVKNNK